MGKFSRWLYMAMLNAGLVQSEVAKKANMSRDAVCALLRGERGPDDLERAKLMKALHRAANDG
jgi:transcriptional regulator with XRE-family HTH domain